MSAFLSTIDDERIVQALRERVEARSVRYHWQPFHEMKNYLADLPVHEARRMDFSASVVRIGDDLPEDHPTRIKLEELATGLIPWKKGPFRLFGIQIDAEWQSDYKWDRFAHALPDIEGQTVLDVGCNNGYYLFRMIPRKPRFVLGLDPIPRLWLQFHLLQHYARIANLDFQMWGWEELCFFKAHFDTVFCMGILYHHSDPIRILRYLHDALKPGGLLVLETIVIPGSDAHCLFPRDRYARMRNVWFVPTVTALQNMLKRAKFIDADPIAVNKHEPEEQRATRWNPGQSYADFIDPNDPDKTIEGHAAPHRAIIFARKRK